LHCERGFHSLNKWRSERLARHKHERYQQPCAIYAIWHRKLNANLPYPLDWDELFFQLASYSVARKKRILKKRIFT